ncbi:hypothetical protein [Sphingomonas xinjiangensis]|uniref:Uncharacterized protein n=1 Tax=Sphingomonas xinjiangensis TaxID=643568 RepID=A0A840YG16_9SPHN|nr:hypothetical protein [Sphingomonas xinjiangensis]MBB5710919.1 hypothetical protein [Sphingomonas xinjiangensis]
MTLILTGAACSPAAPVASPKDPSYAVADAQIPFPDPYRSDLIQIADLIMRDMRKDGAECLEARFLTIPTTSGSDLAEFYDDQLRPHWTLKDLTAAPLTSDKRVFRRNRSWFGYAIADRDVGGSTAAIIVTNTFWDEPSRHAAWECFKSS